LQRIIREGNLMRIYVGNLPYEVTEDELRQQFEAFGEVTSVSIPVDRDSGHSRGYGSWICPTRSRQKPLFWLCTGNPIKNAL
jgi:RNA recognition motif-containing protein